MRYIQIDSNFPQEQAHFEVLPDKWAPSPPEFPAPSPYYEQQTVEGLPVRFELRLNASLLPLSRHSAVYYYRFVRPDQRLNFSMRAYLDWVVFNQKIVFRNIKTNKILIIPAKKRGNVVYARSVYNRLSFHKGGVFEHYLKAHAYHGLRVHCFLWTGTYPLSFGSNSYEMVGKEWNRFQSRLKKKYGKIRFVRAWESTFNGVVHVHGLIFLDEKAPVGFRGRDGLPKFDDVDYSYIKHSWPYISDIEAVASPVRAYYYILKYVFKSLKPQEHDYYLSLIEKYERGEEMSSEEKKDMKGLLTNSQIWIHGKQGYAISGDIRDMLNDHSVLIQERSNSNSEWVCLGVIPDYLYRIPDGLYKFSAESIQKMILYEGWTDT